MLNERVEEALKVEHKAVTIMVNGIGVNLNWKPGGLVVAIKESGDPLVGSVATPWYAMPPNVRLGFSNGYLILKIRSTDGKYVEQMRRALSTDLAGFPDEITVSWGSA